MRKGRANDSADVARKPSDWAWASSSERTSRNNSLSSPHTRARVCERSPAGLASTASKAASISGQRSAIAELAIEPGPRLLPIQLHRALRPAFGFGDLFDRESSEEAQLDGLAQPLIETGKSLQRFVQREHLAGPLTREGQLL